MHRALSPTLLVFALAALGTTACATDAIAPRPAAPSHAALAVAGAPWGPQSPPFNLEAVLRAPTGQDGFGLVKFRQPNDADQIAYLDVWVRDLAPNGHYILQRATDAVVDGNCTGTDWLDLSSEHHPTPINTDDRGTGRAAMHLDLAPFPVGTTFDIQFRLVDAFGGTVMLTSGCYQFTVMQ
jgi:hypothetical protein